jgi:hypothetical protein
MLSLRALRRSMQHCHFDRALFLSDRKVDSKGIESVQIPPLRSKEDYSIFVIKELNNYVETDFVLVIQYDGFIINPDSWTNEFRKFDYIGAKWKYTDGFNVGNGGFSLRSKRLLTALSSERFPLDHAALKSGEDHFICRLHRRVLESSLGMRFGPEIIADKFSYEYVDPHRKTFGFHGLFNIWRHIGYEEVNDFVSLLSQTTLASKEVLFLGLNYHRMLKFDQARTIYRRILQCYPNNTPVSLLLDMVHKKAVPNIHV